MYLLIIISGILLGLMYVFVKLLSSEKYHPATFSAVYALICTVFILPFAFIGAKFPTSWQFWALSIISPIMFGLSFFASVKEYSILDVSVGSLIGRLSLVFGTVAGIILINDPIPKYFVISMVLLLIGSGIIVYEKGKFELNMGVFWAVCAAVGYGLIAVLDKKILEQFSPLTYVFFNNLVVFVTFFMVIPRKMEIFEAIKEFPVKTIVMSLCGVASWSLFLLVIPNLSIVIAYPMWESIALLTTMIVGVFVLNEKTRIKQKVIGTLLTIIGIVFISLL